ncbi:MAG: metalloregulator ArsR/SmtB family transcription factor [Dehalococcoidia bacterium]|nr:metalloregulator ArsR/SmtB family transcription factor [Dehalococcoidia bacterium]
MVQTGSNIETHAKFFRGLADSARLSLLMELRDGPRPAGELAMACALSPSKASNHLQCLLECGLVAVEAQGRKNVYALADPSITALLGVSHRIVNGPAGRLIEACRKYGPPSRRKLRVSKEPPVASGGAAAPLARGIRL